MALATFVKISNISSLSDARYCAGMMVHVLGFNLDPQSDHPVSIEDFNEISEWVSGVKFAGEFHTAKKEEIIEVLKSSHLDYIQLTRMDMVEAIQLIGKPIIFRIEINDSAGLAELKGKLSYLDELVEMVVLKCPNENLFEELDAFIRFYHGNTRLLKGYGVEARVGMAKFPGIEMEASKEERPGYQDYGDIMDVLEVLDED